MRNINTILVWVAIVVVGFVAFEARWENAKQLEVLENQGELNESIVEKITEIWNANKK